MSCWAYKILCKLYHVLLDFVNFYSEHVGDNRQAKKFAGFKKYVEGIWGNPRLAKNQIKKYNVRYFCLVFPSTASAVRVPDNSSRRVSQTQDPDPWPGGPGFVLRWPGARFTIKPMLF